MFDQLSNTCQHWHQLHVLRNTRITKEKHQWRTARRRTSLTCSVEEWQNPTIRYQEQCSPTEKREKQQGLFDWTTFSDDLRTKNFFGWMIVTLFSTAIPVFLAIWAISSCSLSSFARARWRLATSSYLPFLLNSNLREFRTAGCVLGRETISRWTEWTVERTITRYEHRSAQLMCRHPDVRRQFLALISDVLV